MRTSKAQQEQLQEIRRCVNSPKHELIKLVRELEDMGQKSRAEALDRLVGKLEAWQHK